MKILKRKEEILDKSSMDEDEKEDENEDENEDEEPKTPRNRAQLRALDSKIAKLQKKASKARKRLGKFKLS